MLKLLALLAAAGVLSALKAIDEESRARSHRSAAIAINVRRTAMRRCARRASDVVMSSGGSLSPKAISISLAIRSCWSGAGDGAPT